jgi:LmbE family N-acetylglucosaminyl deacetylase
VNWGQKVLVVGAHPDDLEMNAGGTIHKLAHSGIEVHAITLARYTAKGMRWDERVNESYSAQQRLCVKESLFSDGVDTRLSLSKSEQIEFVDDYIKMLRPHTVIGHFFADTHQDHVAAYEITTAAARNVPNLLLFKPTYPSGRTDIPFHPTFISALSSLDMDAKVGAMKEFKTQETKYGEDRWVESLKATAAGDAWTYGGFHGNAELFQVSRLLG